MAPGLTSSLLPQVSYAYIGHFARYVRPGARRILCAATRQVLETTAFLNPDHSVVLVVMNRSEEQLAFVVKIQGTQWPVQLPPHSIASYLLPYPAHRAAGISA